MWSFYDRQMQPVIKEMFDITMENVGSKWEYNFLSYNNLSLFLNISSFPPHFYHLLPAHQSDYIRMMLLEKYGGWWIDTSLIINDNSILEEFYKEITEKKAEFFGVCNIQCPRKLVENGFIYAPKGSIIIKKWREEMEEINREGLSNYIYNTYRSGVTFHYGLFNFNYPNLRTYMTAFVAEQKVFDRLIPRNTSIIIKEGSETLYAMHRYCKEKNLTYSSLFFDKEKRKTFPLIKINSWLRKRMFKGKGTVNAYGKIFDPVKVKKGSEVNWKRLLDIFFYLFLYTLLNLILIYLWYITSNIK